MPAISDSYEYTIFMERTCSVFNCRIRTYCYRSDVRMPFYVDMFKFSRFGNITAMLYSAFRSGNAFVFIRCADIDKTSIPVSHQGFKIIISIFRSPSVFHNDKTIILCQ